MTQQTKCKSCLGKKQVSVYKGDQICCADFPGDVSFVYKKGGIEMVDCSRCNGTGLDPNKQVDYETNIEDETNPTLTYENGLERGRQLGYKEGWKEAKLDSETKIKELIEKYKEAVEDDDPDINYLGGKELLKIFLQDINSLLSTK